MADEPIPLFNLQAPYQALKPRLHQAVLEALNSNQWLLGPQTAQFEEEFAQLIGVKHCIACSGGGALHLALRAAGIGPGDEVITTPFAFSTTAASIALTGADFVFADIDPRTYTLDVQDAERKITKNTKAILPVHLYGYPANMEAIMHLANEHGLKVIEGCSQAILSQADGVCVGGIGTAGAFSFYPGNNVSACANTGCVTTNDDELAAAARALRHCGRAPDNPNSYICDGYPLCMDEVQAAMLRVQLPLLEQWTDARRKAAAWYEEGLCGVPVTLPPTPPAGWSQAFSLYTIRAERRDELMAYLRQHGIGCAVYYPASLYSQPVYAHLQLNPQDYPHTQQACQEVLSLPMFPEITPEQVQRVCDVIRAFYEQDATV